MSLFNFIKSQLSILDIVSEYVQIKPAGNYYKGPCPFHSEKDASFTVSPDKGIFYCFGCHTSGDLISFIAKIENLTQFEAVKHIIDRHNITIPSDFEKEFKSTVANQKNEKERHSYICEEISNWLQQKLFQSRDALNYLTNRNISKESIETFKIGYFPGGLKSSSSFIQTMQSKNIMIKELLEIGFLSQNGQYFYSPFEERIIFSIKDILGRFVGFGGRIFKPEDTRAKYYNSKECTFFQKGQLLFGFDIAKNELRKKETAFLVEGYTDCVTMWQHGYKNSVATLGTACSQDHLKILSRQIKTLFVLYDGDAAGQKAILRLVDLCWETNLDLKIILLPKEDDPASFLQAGKDLKPLIDNAKDIFEFFIETNGGKFGQKTLGEKLEIGKKIIAVIAKIDNKFKREILLAQAASTMQISIDIIKELMETEKTQNNSIDEKASPSIDKKNDDFEEISQLEKKIFFAILNKLDTENVYQIEPELVSQFSQQVTSLLGKLKTIEVLPKGKRFSTFFTQLTIDEQNWVSSNIINFDQDLDLSSFEKLKIQFQKQVWKVMVSKVKNEILEAKNNQNQEKLQESLHKFAYLKEEMKNRGIL